MAPERRVGESWFMKYQLIPALGLVGLMALCGYFATQLDSDARAVKRPAAAIAHTSTP